jgi:hypothetical protein
MRGFRRRQQQDDMLTTAEVPGARVGLIDRSTESRLQIFMVEPEILLRCRNTRIARTRYHTPATASDARSVV